MVGGKRCGMGRRGQRAGILDIQLIGGKQAMRDVRMGLVIFGQKAAGAVLFMEFDQKGQGDDQRRTLRFRQIPRSG